MTATRIVAIISVFAVACAGWMILGTATVQRSQGASDRLEGQVEASWGASLVQQAPVFTLGEGADARPLLAQSSVVVVDLKRDYRRKGLVWYPTYVCAFGGDYRLENAGGGPRTVHAHVDFPAKGSTYDGFVLALDGQDLAAPVDVAKGVDAEFALAPGQARTLRVAYRTRGIGEWRYRPGARSGRVHGLDLKVSTDFREVDYPEGTISPMAAQPAEGGGMALSWTTSDLITTQDIGVVIPEKLNPGPIVARITWFAPVCLLFFFVLVAAITVVERIAIHPMHYLFVAAGFFAFHLLLAYLVDVIDIHLAFAISALTTVTLVTGYLAAALGRRFPVSAAVGGQLFFLVLFSYSFFLKGMTGLTVAVGSVLTLAVLMALTAKLDWNEVFGAPRRIAPAQPRPA